MYRQGNTLKPFEYNTPFAPKGVKRHIDAQDIPPGTPPGTETTGHRARGHKKRYKARTRGARSMGRYPFLEYLTPYLEDCKHRKAPNTLWQEERTLKRIHTYFIELKNQGRVTTTNPKKITEKDIKEFLYYIQQKGLHINTQAKYSQYMLSFLIFCENASMNKLRQKKELPKARHDQDILVLTEGDAARLLDVADQLKGWQGAVISFVVRFHLYTGLRAGELRKAHLVDIDTNRWTFYIRHPKGENSWGNKATIPIIPSLRPYVLEYLDKREKRLNERGIEDCVALLPNLNTRKDKGDFYIAQTLLKMRYDLIDASGVDFDFRMLRRCCGQFLRDRGVAIDAVSKILRHKTTRTTELYYARIRDSKAYEEVEDAWSRRPLASQETKNPLIEIVAR